MSFIAAAILGTGALSAGANLFSGMQIAGAEQQAQGTIQSMTQQGQQSILDTLSQGTGALGSYTTQGIDALLSQINRGAGAIGRYTGGAVGALSPYAQTGTQAGNELSLLQNPSTMAAALEQSPIYQFQRQAGMWGVNNAATAGSGLGGNVLTAAGNYQQGMAQSSVWAPLMASLQNTFQTGAGAAGQQASALSTGGTSIGQLFGQGGLTAGTLYGGAGQTAGGLYTGAGSNIASLLGGAAGNIAQTQIGAAQAMGGAATGSTAALSNAALMAALVNKGAFTKPS